MMIQEISVFIHLAEAQLSRCISLFWGLPVDKVGPSDLFWGRIGTSAPLSVGLNMSWSDSPTGYQTLAKLYFADERRCLEDQWVQFSMFLSERFQTEVAIGKIELSSTPTGAFWVIEPTGKVCTAYEAAPSSDEDDSFVLEKTSNCKNIADIIQDVRDIMLQLQEGDASLSSSQSND